MDSERIAAEIDRKFENSSEETKTQSEQEFQLGFLKQLGDIGFIVNAISGAVFFTILILTGYTMSQAVRERIPELAVLKCLGFTDRTVLGLVLAVARWARSGPGLAALAILFALSVAPQALRARLEAKRPGTLVAHHEHRGGAVRDRG